MHLDATFFALVGLLLFVGLLIYLGVHKTIGKALDNRSDSIARELNEARKLREEAAQVLAQYQKKASDAEVEARSIVEQATREAAALAEEAKARGEQKKIEWGSQIRSYVLDKQYIKDHRTGLMKHNPDDVLDGDLDDLMWAGLEWMAGKRVVEEGTDDE